MTESLTGLKICIMDRHKTTIDVILLIIDFNI